MITTRTLREHEPIPEGFATGFESMPIMRDFIWVAESRVGFVGVLIAAPCHGLAYVMRLCVKKYERPTVATILLRACMKDLEKLGFSGYFFHLSMESDVERRLLPICRRAGAVQIPLPQVAIVGNVAKAASF